MAGRFVPGHLAPTSWQRAGLPAAVELNVKDHSIDISVMLHDVTGVKATGATRARIAGPLDLAGTMTLDLDLDEVPWAPAVDVSPGVSGLLRYGISHLNAAARIELPLICEKVRFQGGTDKELMWIGDWKANSLAGVAVYPAL